MWTQRVRISGAAMREPKNSLGSVLGLSSGMDSLDSGFSGLGLGFLPFSDRC